MAKKNSIKRGVSFYSFQEEYFLRKMTVEDMFATLAEQGAPGVEIIPDQMIPGYPNISPEFLKKWHSWLDKYELTPVCIDMFLDWNKYKGRAMNDDEKFASVTMDIINANKLGCTVIRVIHDADPVMLERLAPIAEKFDVKLALEIHAPSYYDSPFEQRLIEIFRRVQSPYLCFTLDMGVFCNKLPKIVSDRMAREGMKPEIVQYLIDGYDNRTLPSTHELGKPNTGLRDIILKMGGTQNDVYFAMMGTHMIMGDPALLPEYIPFTSHIHGKFYEMLPDYTEYSIPYEELIPILIDSGYDGYIDSEYEGNRWIQDAFEVDSVEQVRRHQMMLKRLLGEE